MKALAVILIVSMLFIPLRGFSGFTASDPQDTDLPDFDIIKFGAFEKNNSLIVWMQVRGKIEELPTQGYIKSYDVNISSDSEYVHFYLVSKYDLIAEVYAFVKDSTSSYSFTNYTVSGANLSVTLPLQKYPWMMSNPHFKYTAMIAKIGASVPEAMDTAEYPEENNSGGGEVPYMYYGLAIGIAALCSVAAYLFLRRKK